MYGRGGAGNIAQAKETSKKAAEDLEANRPAPSSTASTSEPPAPTSQTASQEYAHMGRGGAGNWYQPASLEKGGVFSQPADATAIPTAAKPQISTPWHPDGQEMPVARAGRGGAGNFVWRSAVGDKGNVEGEEKKFREVVALEVERGVEAGLQRPGAAVLSGEKPGRGW